ncbi:MAG: AlpA family phage regulatory protein [Gammaproteobacteria bacterium]|nr:AlpA family phage regulatory protein [Gammaproteobacteria bacterium]
MTDIQLLSRNEVLTLLSVSKSTLYKLLRDSGFPKPIHLSDRVRAWKLSEVTDWIEARSAEREQAA